MNFKNLNNEQFLKTRTIHSMHVLNFLFCTVSRSINRNLPFIRVVLIVDFY